MEDTVLLTSTEFLTSAPQILSQLWKDQDFTDVTLVTADSQQISVHKAILSACSPFFKQLFLLNPHPRPTVYLKGVQAQELKSLMEYMYLGGSKVQEQHLDTFLEVGEELGICGLVRRRKEEADLRIKQEISCLAKFRNSETKTVNKAGFIEQQENAIDLEILNSDMGKEQITPMSFEEMAQPTPIQSPRQVQVQCEKCRMKYQNSNKMRGHICKALLHQEATYFKCKLCSLTVQQASLLQEHIEAKHSGKPEVFKKERKRRCDANVFLGGAPV